MWFTDDAVETVVNINEYVIESGEMVIEWCDIVTIVRSVEYWYALLFDVVDQKLVKRVMKDEMMRKPPVGFGIVFRMGDSNWLNNGREKIDSDLQRFMTLSRRVFFTVIYQLSWLGKESEDNERLYSHSDELDVVKRISDETILKWKEEIEEQGIANEGMGYVERVFDSLIPKETYPKIS